MEVDDIHDAEEEFFLNGEEFGEVAGENVGEELDFEGVGAEFEETDAAVFRRDAGVGFEQRAEFGEEGLQLGGGESIFDADGMAEEDLVALAEVFDIHGSELAIGDVESAALDGTETSGAEADILDGGDGGAELAAIADADAAVAEEGEAAEEIFESFLRGEGDGDTADAKAGEGGGDVVTEGLKGDEGSAEQDKHLEEAAAELEDGLSGGERIAGKILPDAAIGVTDDTKDRPDKKRDPEDLDEA